ncbi:MAG TPA: flagellar basal body-associated FliL family protein [Nocardioidaceae bacterium]|nr:flagellar basal body-associated FliL family protein [Nocardioidaceae bacterium]
MTTTQVLPTQAAGEEEQVKPKGKKKKLLLVFAVVLLLAGGAWWFMLRPAPADAKPEPGAVVTLDAIQVNLAHGHYLRIGIALQTTKSASPDLDGSKALDATISLFSGQSMHRLAERTYRHKLKSQLEHRLEKSYDEEVMGVYFTDFVTQ